MSLPNPWLILATIIAILGAFLAGQRDGITRERTEWAARIEKERAESFKAGLETERNQQEKTNAALKTQAAAMARINTGLRRDLDGLRNRPERPADLPEIARAACQGTTGAELSRPDAEFLVGEAARADEQRAGLDACYQVMDALQ